MCFYNDNYDWFASLTDESDVALDKPTKCVECRRQMEIGEVASHIFQQEHEECHSCTEGECSCPKDEDDTCQDCQCEEPDFGETYECDRCQECKKFLSAIEEHEKDEGCPPGERQPAYGEMAESLREFPRKERSQYFRKAYRMFPELKRSGYLNRIASKIF